MTYKIFLFFLLLFLFNPLILKAQDETQTSTSTTVTNPQPVQEVPAIITKVNAIEKEFKWVSTTTMNIVISSILLCPEPYQDYAISQYRTILNRELSAKNEQYVSRAMVLKALEEMSPHPEHFQRALEALGVIQKDVKYIHPRVESGMRVMKQYQQNE